MAQEPPAGFPPQPPSGLGYAPPPPPDGPPPDWGTPWDRRNELGLVTALVETTKEVLSSPTSFYRKMPVAGGIGSPLLYGVIIGYLGLLVGAFYSAVFLMVGAGARSAASFGLGDRPEVARIVEALSGWGNIVGQVIFGPIGIVIGIFVWAAILHVILLLLDGAAQGFEATFRVLAYAQAASIFAIVPICGSLIAAIYAMVITIIGLAEAQRIPAWKAAVAVLLPLFLCCCCCAAGVATMVGGFASALSHAR